MSIDDDEEEVIMMNGDVEDFWIEDGVRYIGEREQKTTTTKFYILNMTASTKMSNGFRYIKEMLLQNHNYRMYEAFKKMKSEGVEVLGVKTDAFYIKKTDTKKIKKCWTFIMTLEGGELKKIR